MIINLKLIQNFLDILGVVNTVTNGQITKYLS